VIEKEKKCGYICLLLSFTEVGVTLLYTISFMPHIRFFNIYDKIVGVMKNCFKIDKWIDFYWLESLKIFSTLKLNSCFKYFNVQIFPTILY